MVSVFEDLLLVVTALSLHVATANKLILQLVYLLNIEVEKSVALAVPCVRRDNRSLPNGLDIHVAFVLEVLAIALRHFDFGELLCVLTAPLAVAC